MSIRSEKAMKSFEEGYNCAQAVISAFDDLENKEELLKIASSFGGGMGGMRQVCGAVSAMAIIAGAKEGYNTPERGKIKKDQAELVRKMATEYSEVTGSVVCGELLGLEGFKQIENKNKLPCKELVKLATEILEKNLPTHKPCE